METNRQLTCGVLLLFPNTRQYFLIRPQGLILGTKEN